MQPPQISAAKVASLYLIPTINNKGIKQKRIEENKGFAVFLKRCPKQPEAVICLVVLFPVYTGTK